MMLRRFDVRRFGNWLAVAGWFLLVTDPCIDLGTVDAPIGPISAHGAADSDEADGTVHAECAWALLASADRDPLAAGTGVDPTGSLVSAAPSLLVGAPAPVKLRSTDVARSRSPVPLYLLHAVFLI